MSELARMFIGVILLATPIIQNLNYFMGKICCLLGCKCSSLTDAQKTSMRATHAHTGCLIVLSIFAEFLIDFAVLPLDLDYIIRYTFPISTVLIALGYYFVVKHKGQTKPSRLCGLLCLGSLGIMFSVIVLGIGLIKHV